MSQLIFTLINEFEDKTTVEKTLMDDGIESIFWAIRECLAGCGYSQDTIDDWFSIDPEEEDEDG